MSAVTSHDANMASPTQSWIEYMQAGGYSPRTITDRARTIAQLETAAGKPALYATTRDLQKWLATPWKPGTRQTYQHTLNAYYRWAYDMGLRGDDPTERLARAKVPRRRPRPMSDLDFHKVMKTRVHPKTRVMILLAAYAGLRAHEIAKVHSDDVDVDNMTLTVNGKGGVSRYIPIHEKLHPYVNTVGYWFPNTKDSKLGPAGTAHVLPNGVSAIISQVLRRAGVEGTPHTLRHRFATRLLKVGVDIRVVQELMGHASLATTSLYVAVDMDQQRAAIGAL